MKTISFLSLLGFLLLATSCSKDEKNPDIKLDKEFELDYEETGIFNDGNFTIEFIDILEESRCPENVVCFWEGRARVQVKITEGMESSTHELVTLNSINGDSLLTATYGQYQLELKDVKPYPVDGESVDFNDYSLKLELTEL